MSISKTYGVKDEELPWRALADAVIVQAVQDYRICSQRIRQIQNRLHRRRGRAFETISGRAGCHPDFFFSPSFHVLSDLDGPRLLKRLDQEVL